MHIYTGVYMYDCFNSFLIMSYSKSNAYGVALLLNVTTGLGHIDAKYINQTGPVMLIIPAMDAGILKVFSKDYNWYRYSGLAFLAGP